MLAPQYFGLAMSVMQRFGARCVKEVSELKHFSVKKIREWAERCKEGCSRFALQRGEGCGSHSSDGSGKK